MTRNDYRVVEGRWRWGGTTVSLSNWRLGFLLLCLMLIFFFVFQLVIYDTYTRLARGGKGQRATRPGAGQGRNAGASVQMQFKTKQ